MSELISGKEAWIALYDGFDIQIRLKDVKRGWLTIKHDSLTLSDIKSEHYEFRLKPRTITLNGIEVPECGKDYKYGNAMYILNSLEIGEYCMVVLDKADEVPAYWWRTEEEIKQVVSALRSIFK